jgi:L-threonylcarbamoyladenylate synthase
MITRVGQDINIAESFLRMGELVAIPTETVYGLAANALDTDAVLKIFKVKNRPYFNPLIVHLSSWQLIEEYAENIPEVAHELARHFTPGPITFLLPRKKVIPDLVTAGSDKVALRIPNHPLTQRLLKNLEFPLAAPSANPFGYVSPTNPEHVLQGLAGKIPYILDGGPSSVGLESTILDFEDNQVIMRRKGGLSVEKLEKVIGQPIQMSLAMEEHPTTPGQLKSHYATQTPLYIGDLTLLLSSISGKKVCIIDFGGTDSSVEVWRKFDLSTSGNLDEAARNLFSIMREADACGADVILANLLQEEGLGRAINDRLKRASFEAKQSGSKEKCG